MFVASLAAAITLLLSLVAGSTAMAQPPPDRDMRVTAGQPHAYKISGDRDAYVNHRDFFWNGDKSGAGRKARDAVHNPYGVCGAYDNLCTIQTFNNDRYRVYLFHGCARFGLDNFTGLWDAHNWQPRTAFFLEQDGTKHAEYWSGRDTPVNWTPVWRILTCAR
ncbi:hypothetical protein [Streptomyces phytophilus]|uniref:hypothetical protein n=1 Tax=Streptomyces phytophilus TaxID=722715 RepID=UPI00215D9C83|nr:hypothetical protein [Streptomyces phytophilus]